MEPTKNTLKVYFIGAGPGDVELLTLKAARIIRKADIIIYAGSLVNKDILGFAKKAAVSYDSAKMTLEEVIGIIENEKSNKKIIARLHTGDPSLYGAIQEQMDWCEKEKIAYEVIPGVSSFQAAAASLKQEFTLPGVSQTVILTRLSGRTKVPKREDLEQLAKIRATLVIFLSVQDIARVVKKLKCGYVQNTPVIVVERVSWPDERKISGTLADIAKKVKQAGIKRQALIIIGDVLRKKYRLSKLYDKNFTHGFRKKIGLVGQRRLRLR
ncbi:MAG: precorrin-4 C(11)-methyltransferase [Omnitrophica WOR_2 bacterium GWF2_43_52]|nr:MAG: precorrin-4 C(11)-methyltransferase [Omnitrophica WOR_2 bacterium GWC2_44_8]OGX22668.1 MAG: precorrin-4 C(11)-methyltransferase [Omnitrophica WOR_2 bacterium GWF2_43_52]OGX53272.1 MAG: precorrin-4 C(11)-methyltransferase [Omnitrophica WOR_2 bacterium RIFOXYC2_FULL_43_9]HAH20808.1 precorrin-4 C(11)-methyltransferase [Candidatus Omnitrophota bacterium]HBG64476.1 precorrin-4 C(11)-methyltransferase [Candidatus Omnitrophota bacterium]